MDVREPTEPSFDLPAVADEAVGRAVSVVGSEWLADAVSECVQSGRADADTVHGLERACELGPNGALSVAVYGSCNYSNRFRDIDAIVVADVPRPFWKYVEGTVPLEIFVVPRRHYNHLLSRYSAYPFTWVWEAGKFTSSTLLADREGDVRISRAALQNPPFALRAFVLTFAVGQLAVLDSKLRQTNALPIDAVRAFASALASLSLEFPRSFPILAAPTDPASIAEALTIIRNALISLGDVDHLLSVMEKETSDWCKYPANAYGRTRIFGFLNPVFESGQRAPRAEIQG